ncbi:MAG: YggS family pyridoxal phosphate-dependent enzyme [Candidatus Cloacimonetes bacterium]|jgi:PLP dependent protein|nr:YggS family pyridoxal phosphate-dependent enzyme [Candidatus Cloacimonadota bacterium]
MMNIQKNIENLKIRIAKSARDSARNIEEIKLLAVTKTHSAELVQIVLKNGLKCIAENKIQEAKTKLPELQNVYDEFHFIGHLQSNKIKQLMKLKPALIHSIDKISTAKKLNDFLFKNNLKQEILIQINTSNEASKFGVEPSKIVAFVDEITQLSNLKIMGLMTIGKFTSNETEIRDNFKKLKEIFENLKRKNLPNLEMKYLSMGMTNDFEIAIEEGANIVRIGSAIFGDRNY